MQAERFRQVRNLFDAALERAPESRQAFLAEACSGDPELLREVGRLLAAHGEPTGWIDADVADAPAPRLEGKRFGPYEVLRQLGAGGMGSVYLAARADGVYRKHVALKIVRAAAATPDVVARFQREREILALLDHPNIARIIDGGTTDDGLPYLVMDHVEGEPIDVYCDRHRLDVPARLKLFRDVCAAVQYAHEHKVVHRDLKPSNILVTSDGVVKLLDFGIARLGESASLAVTVLTRTDMCLMTPEYASPEQVSGGTITPATDVYALGVVLYELLTGRKPYRMRSRIIHEVVRVIREEAPTRPSTAVTQADSDEAKTELEVISRVRAASIEDLKRELSGDLDCILLKALNKDSVDRYPTAGSLSQDLQRHLEGTEVAAREGQFARILAEFGRRSVWVLLAAIAVALLLYKRVLRAEQVLIFGLPALFLLSVYAASQRIFGKAFVKSRVSHLAKPALAFTLFWIGGISLVPTETALIAFFFLVGAALNAYAWYRAARWLRRTQTLGAMRHDVSAPGSGSGSPSGAAFLHALGAGFWCLLLLTVVMFWFGWLYLEVGRRNVGSAFLALGILMVVYAFRGHATPTREKALVRPSWFGAAFVLLSLLLVTALITDDRAIKELSWKEGSAFYLLVSWMLVPLLIAGRNEIRERGLAWSGRLIPWSDVLSYAWQEDTGLVEVLQMRIRRGRSSQELRLALMATQRPLLDAALKQYIAEWPSDLRSQAATAMS